jgi:hypothetical protein
VSQPFIPPIISLPQDSETPAHRDLAPGTAGTYTAFTYVYARSRDTREAHSTGQDFIAYRYDEQRIAFVVCDGVSQSFFGDLAARFLGLRLVEWLWTADTSDQSKYLSALNDALQGWSHDATVLVDAKTFRADLPEMQKIALERKRANGSESMFVAGQIDRQTNRLALCWLGDMRLHLWAQDDNKRIEIPGAVWETRERWSTRVGPKNGEVRGCVLPLTGIRRITAHSDGVGHFVDSFSRLAQDQLGPMVDELQMAPTSDDVSVFDIDLNVPAPYGDYLPLAAPQWAAPQQSVEPVLRWQAVPFATRYRVWIDDGQSPYTREIDGASTTFFPVLPPSVDPNTTLTLSCAVQAINDYALPSPWSASLTFHLDGTGKTTVEVAPAAAPETAGEVDHDSPKPKAPKKKKRRRGQAFLILLVSALILAILMTIAWIGSTVTDWPTLISTLLRGN